MYLLQEHRAPLTVFSVAAFSQEHFMAGILPQEQVASAAHAQPPEARPQQVAGGAAAGADIARSDDGICLWSRRRGIESTEFLEETVEAVEALRG